jgi:hypothetical protein
MRDLDAQPTEAIAQAIQDFAFRAAALRGGAWAAFQFKSLSARAPSPG